MALTLNGTTGISGIAGSAGTPALQGTDTNTGYFFGTDILGLSTSGTEKLRIDSAGKVGIGTNSPAFFISIENTAPYIRVKDTAAPTDEKTWDFNAGTDGILRFRNTNDAANSSNNWLEVERDGVTTSSIRLLTGSGSERLRITTSEIEIKNDGSRMLNLITTSGTGSCYLGFSDSGGQKGYLGYGSGGNEVFYIVQNENAQIQFYSNGHTRAFLNTDGKFNFDKYGDTAGKGRIEFGNSGEQYIEGYDTGNAGSGSYLSFGDGNGEKLRINNGGVIGIGSTSPGTSSKVFSYQSDGSAGNNVILENNYSANGITTLLKAYRQGGAVGYALQYKDSTTRMRQGTYTNHAMELFTNDNARITIANDGHVVLSNSIAFRNETTADNRLDDYEEGVHTQAPVNANLTLTNNILRYTKIGRLVTVSGILKPSAVSSSNAVQITLPFTSVADSGNTCGRYTSALMHKFVNIDDSYRNVVGYIGQNEAYWRIYHVGDNLDWHQLTNNDLSTNTEIFFTFTYHTTD